MTILIMLAILPFSVAGIVLILDTLVYGAGFAVLTLAEKVCEPKSAVKDDHDAQLLKIIELYKGKI